MDASGDFVVTWESCTGSGYDIFAAQRFMSRVCPRGPEFRVNSTTATQIRRISAVAMDAAGNFVMTWVNGAGVGADIHSQRYNSLGVPEKERDCH